MRRRVWVVLFICTYAFVLIQSLDGSNTEAEERQASFVHETVASTEMEKKVSSATKIVSGLARENYDLIREGASEWRQMSESAAWDRNRSSLYAMYSREFEQACERLILAAEQKQTERATFAYMQATVSCITCHAHVRDRVRVSKGSVHRTDGPAVFR
jgi:hypothetical protein